MAPDPTSWFQRSVLSNAHWICICVLDVSDEFHFGIVDSCIKILKQLIQNEDKIFNVFKRKCILNDFIEQKKRDRLTSSIHQCMLYIWFIYGNQIKYVRNIKIKDTKVKIVRNVQKTYTNSVSIGQHGPLKTRGGIRCHGGVSIPCWRISYILFDLRIMALYLYSQHLVYLRGTSYYKIWHLAWL